MAQTTHCWEPSLSPCQVQLVNGFAAFHPNDPSHICYISPHISACTPSSTRSTAPHSRFCLAPHQSWGCTGAGPGLRRSIEILSLGQHFCLLPTRRPFYRRRPPSSKDRNRSVASLSFHDFLGFSSFRPLLDLLCLTQYGPSFPERHRHCRSLTFAAGYACPPSFELYWVTKSASPSVQVDRS